MSQKSCFYFLPKFCAGEFSSTLKPHTRYSKASRTHSYISISRWCYRESYLRNHQQAPILLREMVHQRKKYIACTKYSAFRFRCKIRTLRMKIQRWFFLWRYLNVSPLGIKKKSLNLFWFLTYKLSFAKNRYFVYFRRRHVEAEANNFRRFR